MKKLLLFSCILPLLAVPAVLYAFGNPTSKKDMTVRSFNKSKIFTTIDLSKEGKDRGNIRYFIEYQQPGNTLFNKDKGGMYKIQFHGMDGNSYHTAIVAGKEIALKKGGSLYGPSVYTLFLSEDELEAAWMSDGRLLVQFIGKKGSDTIVFPEFYLEYVFENVMGPSYMSGAPARFGLFGAPSNFKRPGGHRPGMGRPGGNRPGGRPGMGGTAGKPGSGHHHVGKRPGGRPEVSGHRRPGHGRGEGRRGRRGYRVHPGSPFGPSGGGFYGGGGYGAGHPFNSAPSVPQLR